MSGDQNKLVKEWIETAFSLEVTIQTLIMINCGSIVLDKKGTKVKTSEYIDIGIRLTRLILLTSLIKSKDEMSLAEQSEICSSLQFLMESIFVGWSFNSGILVEKIEWGLLGLESRLEVAEGFKLLMKDYEAFLKIKLPIQG